jgi:beta-N-acetylhexosaminidase
VSATRVAPTIPTPMLRAAALSAAFAVIATTLSTTPAANSDTAGAQLAKQVGQMTISPVIGTTPSDGLLDRVEAGEVGGVILFGENIETHPQVRALVRRLQDAARRGGNPGLLVMTDQEGGTVRRFGSIPPTMSAHAMGQHPTATIRLEGRGAGRGLHRDGVNVDLAPVADVPTRADSFLGTRAFAHNAADVARDACAFARGLHDGHVGATLKHFPGLGRASGNTDLEPVTIAGSAATLAPDLRPYRACANAQPTTLVMVSSAIYDPLTAGRPAVVSPAAYALLHTTLRFNGPTISDSLGGAAVAHVPDLATRAAAAGLELWGSQPTAHAGYRALLAGARAGRVPAARIAQAAARIHALKLQLHLTR